MVVGMLMEKKKSIHGMVPNNWANKANSPKKPRG